MAPSTIIAWITTLSHLWPCDYQLIDSNNTTTNNNNDNFNIHHLFITTKEKAAWTKAGPNDTPDVVWAQVSFLFSSFVLLETNDCKYRLYLWYRRKGEGWKTRNNENRPNDARHVVWALGKSFLLFPSYYFDINQYFIAYTGGDLQNTRNQERSDTSRASGQPLLPHTKIFNRKSWGSRRDSSRA